MDRLHPAHSGQTAQRPSVTERRDAQIRLRDVCLPSNLLTLSRLLMLPALVRALLRPERHREALVLDRRRAFPGGNGILLGSLAIYRRRTLVVAAHPAGKATTAALTVALLLYLADGPRSGRWGLALAAVPFILSLLSYGSEYLRQHRTAGA